MSSAAAKLFKRHDPAMKAVVQRAASSVTIKGTATDRKPGWGCATAREGGVLFASAWNKRRHFKRALLKIADCACDFVTN